MALGSILKTAGKYLVKNPAVASGIGSLLGGGAKTAASNRSSQNEVAYLQDQQRMQALRDREAQELTRASLELRQREERRAAQTDAYDKSRRSAAHLNMKDASISRPFGVPMAAISGGLRPSMFGAEGRAAAEAMNGQALRALMNPEGMRELSDPSLFQPSAMKTPGAMENIMSTGGTALTGIGAILAALAKKKSEDDEDEEAPPTVGGNIQPSAPYGRITFGD